MLRRRLHQVVALSAVAAAGVAVSLALFAGVAHAYTTDQLGSLGYSVTVGFLNPDGSCRSWSVSGYGASQDLGSDCDPGFQQRLDAFVNATCPCAQTTTTTPAATTTTTMSTSTNATTTTAPATTTTTDPGANPPAPTVTQTVTTPAPGSPAATPPIADFSAESVNPGVVSFSDLTTSGSVAIASRVWQLGDGAAATGPNVTHVFPGAGIYYVTLIVVDANGLTSIAAHQLTIAADHSVTLGPRSTQLVRKSATTSTAKRAKAHADGSYSGSGTALLPPIRLKASTVHWHASGGLFMLIALQAPAAAGPNPQLIVSQRSSGTGYLPAGLYRFKIGAFGAWRVSFTRR